MHNISSCDIQYLLIYNYIQMLHLLTLMHCELTQRVLLTNINKG